MPADFWVCIPARLASSRLPNKVLQPIGDAPMIVHVLRVALKSEARQVVLAYDDEAIADCIRGVGDLSETRRVELVKTRPDHASGTDRLVEVANTLEAPDGQIMVNLQGDEPLMPAQLLNDIAELLATSPDASVATAACPITSVSEWANPSAVKVVTDAKARALYFSRASIPITRDAPDAKQPSSGALRHIGLYAYRAGALRLYGQWPEGRLEQLERLEQLRWLENGHRLVVRRLQQAPPAGVDTLEDLDRIRAHWASGL
jgi:3-deoxy-manno-octulosonate cytidylyltransferase (CMP-KDO synthetase)